MISWSGVRADFGILRSRIDSGLASGLRGIVIVTSSYPDDLDYDYDSDASSGLRPETWIFSATLSTSLEVLNLCSPILTLFLTCSASDFCNVFSPVPAS